MNDRPSPIDVARQRHPLADVASRTGIPVTATTGTVTVRCPMSSHGHPDHTPSLRLYLDDGTWYCFACSARAGDVVEWAAQTEHVGWRQAIEILDSGRPLTNTWATANLPSTYQPIHNPGRAETPDQNRTTPGRLQAVLDTAWHHCTAGPLHARAAAYLAGRGINLAVLEDYTGRAEAGHTPTHGPGFAQRLLADGFSGEELVDAGLARRYPGGRLVDFYRHRLLIPIRTGDGHLAGFVGRNTSDPHQPKYINPPRTALYDKSLHLYQPLSPPRNPGGKVIVVEGTLDAIAIAIATAAVQTGRAGTVCPLTQSGRELSDAQLAHIMSLPARVVLALDADPAGWEATCRHQNRARQLGAQVAVAHLPEGHDPASWLAQHGFNALVALLGTGEPPNAGELETVSSLLVDN